MGLLDDAIREHLDLKRRNGADPADIERAERDALGPVRREPTIPSAAVADADPVADAEFDDVFDHDAPASAADPLISSAEPEPVGLDFDAPPSDEYEAVESPEQSVDEKRAPRRRGLLRRRQAEPEPELDPSAEPEPLFDGEDDPFAEHADLAAESEAAPAAAEAVEPKSAAPDEPADNASASVRPHGDLGATVEYDVAGVLAEEDDELLEETPDFLQDAPNHDRLWFEQKPPKDFDI